MVIKLRFIFKKLRFVFKMLRFENASLYVMITLRVILKKLLFRKKKSIKKIIIKL